jgi:hypothetical protein
MGSLEDFNVQWAAGFFEGEGYIGLVQRKFNGKIYPRLVLSIAQVYIEPLQAFQTAVNTGEIRGPYGPYSTTKQSYFQYHANGKDVIKVITQIRPWLLEKGRQADVVIKNYMEYKNEKSKNTRG